MRSGAVHEDRIQPLNDKDAARGRCTIVLPRLAIDAGRRVPLQSEYAVRNRSTS